MIGRLRGELVHRDGNHIIVDCGGVGYEVIVSTYTLAALPGSGASVTLLIYTQVLETRIALYGFQSAAERELFDLLITVKKVGPTSAMSILSGGAGPTEVAQLIAAENVSALTTLRGVGKKTAEMLVVELHEKCELLLATWGASGGVPDSLGAHTAARTVRMVRPPILEDVATALMQLGWKAPEVDKAVGDLEVLDGADLESLLRQALRAMPR
ncbi:MAG TPA: Holliday junction branch migration protein RuvA [Kofleriaceae bacterium]|nr:Holliday junction branch migration protein RuvA [Kofleriaceae bacterium]